MTAEPAAHDVSDIYKALKWMRSGPGLTIRKIRSEEARALFALAATPEDVSELVADAVSALGGDEQDALEVALGVGPRYQDLAKKPYLEARRRKAEHIKSTWTRKENVAFEHLARILTGDWHTPIDPVAKADATVEVAEAIAADARAAVNSEGGIADLELVAGLADELAELARRDSRLALSNYSLGLSAGHGLLAQRRLALAVAKVFGAVLSIGEDLVLAGVLRHETAQTLDDLKPAIWKAVFEQRADLVDEIQANIDQVDDDFEFGLRSRVEQLWEEYRQTRGPAEPEPPA